MKRNIYTLTVGVGALALMVLNGQCDEPQHGYGNSRKSSNNRFCSVFADVIWYADVRHNNPGG